MIDNSKDILVSVHMITYNHEQYIARSIEGILSQRVSFNIELVIGEDYSTDATRKICETYQNNYPHIIKLLPSEKNLGMRENGIRTLYSCTGKYIAFCEGDDFWHDPFKLQKQIDFLENNPEYGMIHSNAHELYQKDKRLVESVCNVEPDYDDENAYFDILTEKRQIATLTVCVRQDLLCKVLAENPEFNDPRYLMGDHLFWLEISRLAKVKYLNESLATYNILQESASHGSDPNKELKFQISAKEIFYHYLSKYECPPDVALKTKYKRTTKVLNSAVKAKNYTNATDQLAELKNLGLKPPWKLSDYILYWGCRNNIQSWIVDCIRLIWSIKKILISL